MGIIGSYVMWTLPLFGGNINSGAAVHNARLYAGKLMGQFPKSPFPRRNPLGGLTRTAQLPHQPGSGELPVAPDTSRGDFEDLGGFLLAESSEVS